MQLALANMWWPVLVVGLTFAFADDKCPDSCHCSRDFTSINCQGKQLRTIPPDIPPTVEKLYLDHNLFTVIRKNDFCFPNLKFLYLQNNKISHMEQYAFNGSCLPRLQILHLENNKIANLVDYTFINLLRINITFLTNNYINSIRPGAFLNTNTETLNLGGNELKSIPPLGNMTNLKNLYLQANKIVNATFPSGYENLLLLNSIGLSNNNIKTLENQTFISLNRCNVHKLELSRNKIAEISEQAFVPLTKPLSLKLGMNPLSASELEKGLNGLQNSSLTSLNIANIELGGSLPSSTFQLLGKTHILDLIMKNNKITEIPARGFSDLGHLLLLDLSDCKLTKTDDLAFSGLKALVTLFMNENNLDKVPKNLPPTLQILYLNSNQITELGDDAFQNLKYLQKLYLGNNQIHTLHERSFSDLVNLRILHLVQNNIGTLPGEIFNSFGRLQSLELNKNNLKTFQKGSDPLSPMSSLLNLNLADNACSYFPPSLFNSLYSLQNLYLQNNNLGQFIANDNTGKILYGLHKLQNLDLSFNGLTKIPDAFFRDLSSVTYLNLRQNMISGWGPNLFYKTSSLSKLDLSHNSISLVNSTSVQDFKNLKSLNMSHNPFACTCDLRWFRDWINKTSIVLENNSTYACNSPVSWKGKPLLSFDRTKINCLWFNLKFLILSVAIAVLIIIVIICLIYHRRWWLRLKFHKLKVGIVGRRAKFGEYQQIGGYNNVYDAYISCSEDDSKWVLDHLLPDIDCGNIPREFGGEFKLYFESRDSEVGHSIIGNIVDNMEISRKVLIILTKKYLTNRRYLFEIELATDLRSQGIIEDIIIVKVEGVPPACVPKMLHRKIEKHEFLEWENDVNAIQAFKEKLKQMLAEHRAEEAVEV